MKYEFRPYSKIQPTQVIPTGKIYEVGEHPIYTDHKIIEVQDSEGTVHDAFEDELRSDEVEKQQRSYSEEEVIDLLQEMNDYPTIFEGRIDIKEWFEQLKKK